jgi:hypothetical protein
VNDPRRETAGANLPFVRVPEIRTCVRVVDDADFLAGDAGRLRAIDVRATHLWQECRDGNAASDETRS